MPLQTMTSAQALANGALAAGVMVVTSYPGSPSSETVDLLIELAGAHHLHVEWSSNEKVAMEIGIGASIAGRRALVCTKSVGMNAMADPLMVLNLTPVHGGLVILLGDDPGGYGSQNDQDTRSIAPLIEMPMMEPATPAEGFAMMQAAFDLSERFHTPMIVRETRSFTQQSEPVDLPAGPYQQPDLGLVREPWRFVPVPKTVVKKHRALHERLAALEPWVNESPFNRIEGTGESGIIAAGFVYRKLLDVIGDPPAATFRLFKLSVLYPLPSELLARFLARCRDVLVLEENEPYVETQIKAIAHEAECRVRILGKKTGHVHREGELFRWQIQQALKRFLPDLIPRHSYFEKDEAVERPPRENHCAGCRFGVIVDALREVAAELGQNPVLIADPGCLTPVADRIDAKFAIGSAVGVAEGLMRAGIRERAVALFGDSSFFHSTLPAIVNAVHQGSDILMVVLDNDATVTSGFQPHPGVIRDARGRPARALNIEQIARACGIDEVHTVGPENLDTQLRPLFHAGLTRPGLRLIVARSPCDHPAELNKK